MLRTGSLGLDILLGGGWKPGTINEIWGEPGTGKTTLAQATVWELEGRKAMWMSLGTEVPHRPSGALLAQPRNAEQAFYIMETCVLGDVKLVVVDSANGLVRQAEIDGDPGYTPHPQREYAAELTRLKEAVKTHGAVVLFLSKPRDRDRQPIRGTGISEKSKARVRLRILHQRQDESRTIEAWVHGRQDRVMQYNINPGTGIDWASELAQLSVQYDVVQQTGTWFTLGEHRFHGIGSLAEHIRDDGDLAADLDDAVRSAAGILE